MYRCYKKSEICFVFLQDYDSNPELKSSKGRPAWFTTKTREPEAKSETRSDPMESEWFERARTLQELIAPREVEFFDRNWKFLGTKTDANFRQMLSSRTGIDERILLQRQGINTVSVASRMSWFQDRKAKVDEDHAHCLMGLFGVNMPTLYGEGMERAFRRLQEEIMKYSDDHSLFAWKDPSLRNDKAGLLARSPACRAFRATFRSR